MTTEKNQWNDLSEPFLALKQNNINYAVLRNFEEFTPGCMADQAFLEGHDDIDIICDQPKKARRILKAKREPFYGYLYHYKTIVGGRIIRFGIRYPGDGYYDQNWEKEMLLEREEKKGLFYALSDEQYFYSLIYHALLHKSKMSQDYKDRLREMGAGLGIRITEGKETDELKDLLTAYMRKRGYLFVYPKDYSLPNRFSHIGVDQAKGFQRYRIRAFICRPALKLRRRLRRKYMNMDKTNGQPKNQKGS